MATVSVGNSAAVINVQFKIQSMGGRGTHIVKGEAISKGAVAAKAWDSHLVFLLTVLGVLQEVPADGAALGGTKELLFVLAVDEPVDQKKDILHQLPIKNEQTSQLIVLYMNYG